VTKYRTDRVAKGRRGGKRLEISQVKRLDTQFCKGIKVRRDNARKVKLVEEEIGVRS
jgi:hypothetical protein